MPTVIYVPGLPGSVLRHRTSSADRKIFPPSVFAALIGPSQELKDLLKGPDDLQTDDDVFAAEPIRTTRFLGFDLMKQADTLYDLFAASGVPESDQIRLGWDWRRPVTDDALPHSVIPVFAARLEDAIATGEQVVVFAHSTGGLIVRHLLESRPDLAPAVSRFVAFGVPWGGTLKPFAVLAGQHGFGPIGAADAQEVFASNWAAFDVLPRANGLRLVTNAAGEVNPLTDLSWVGDHAGEIAPRAAASNSALGTPTRDWTLPIPVTNVAGWGVQSLVSARVAADGAVTFNPSGLDNDDGDFDHPEEDELTYQGDGTVPFVSASWLRGDRVTSHFVPIGATDQVTNGNRRHSELWRNSGIAALVSHHLAGTPAQPIANAAVDWSDKLTGGNTPVRVRYVMRGADGARLPGAEARLENLRLMRDVVHQPGADGRGQIRVENRGIFPMTHGGRFRRVEFRPSWDGAPQQPRQRMFIEP